MSASPSNWSPSPPKRAMRPITSPTWAKDWHVLQHPREQDFILVTNNAVDFRRLYAAEPLHAGLVILLPTVDGAMQQRLIQGALTELTVHSEPINQVLEVDVDGQNATFAFYDLPVLK